MATTSKSGFYGDSHSTYYVHEDGKVYMVQTDDLVDNLPIVCRGGLPGDAVPCDDLIGPDEAAGHVRVVMADFYE